MVFVFASVLNELYLPCQRNSDIIIELYIVCSESRSVGGIQKLYTQMQDQSPAQEERASLIGYYQSVTFRLCYI